MKTCPHNDCPDPSAPLPPACPHSNCPLMHWADPTPAVGMREYPQREIFRHGRYAMCQVMTRWTSSQDCPKYIACNDPERGDQFLAEQAMGTWCEVDMLVLADRLRSAPAPAREDGPDITSDLYSDAMDAAAGAYAFKAWEQCKASEKEPIHVVKNDGETIMRERLAAAITAFLKEYPESDLVRLARPPAPNGKGTTVGVQPVARIPSVAPAPAVGSVEKAEQLAALAADELTDTGSLHNFKRTLAALLDTAQREGVADREKVARWMMANGFATGHGDTIDDLLAELKAQIQGAKS